MAKNIHAIVTKKIKRIRVRLNLPTSITVCSRKQVDLTDVRNFCGSEEQERTHCGVVKTSDKREHTCTEACMKGLEELQSL